MGYTEYWCTKDQLTDSEIDWDVINSNGHAMADLRICSGSTDGVTLSVNLLDYEVIAPDKFFDDYKCWSYYYHEATYWGLPAGWSWLYRGLVTEEVSYDKGVCEKVVPEDESCFLFEVATSKNAGTDSSMYLFYITANGYNHCRMDAKGDDWEKGDIEAFCTRGIVGSTVYICISGTDGVKASVEYIDHNAYVPLMWWDDKKCYEINAQTTDTLSSTVTYPIFGAASTYIERCLDITGKYE